MASGITRQFFHCVPVVLFSWKWFRNSKAQAANTGLFQKKVANSLKSDVDLHQRIKVQSY